MNDTDKLADCLSLLARNNIVNVVVVPSTRGVWLPSHLMGDREVRLRVGYGLPVPITDLKVDERGIRATLSFDRRPHTCVVPWEAVVQLHGETSGYHSYRGETVPLLNFTAAAKVREPFVPRVIQGGKK